MNASIKKIKKVYFRKIDLDTLLTVILLDLMDKPYKFVKYVSNDDIYNLEICCIECGGSGLIEYNNFDHHDIEKTLPCAAKQAYSLLNISDNYMKKLVHYVELLDNHPFNIPEINGYSLSYIFSGLLMYYNDIEIQYKKGLDFLKKVINNKIDPFKPISIIDENWEKYIIKKKDNNKKLVKALKNTKFFSTQNGKKFALLIFDGIGGSNYLYSKGCDIVILNNPVTLKTCIMSKNVSLKNLYNEIIKINSNWGGRKNIICTEKLTSFSLEFLCELIKKIY